MTKKIIGEKRHFRNKFIDFSYNIKVYNPNRAANYADGFCNVSTTDPRYFFEKIFNCVWSPITFNKNYRCESNFISSGVCALDFENPNYTLNDAKRDFKDFIHVIGTSRSHQISKNGKPGIDRFRVVIPFEEVIYEPHIYKHNIKKIISMYGSDPAAKDCARFFFPCRELIQYSIKGHTIKVEHVAPILECTPQDYKKYLAVKIGQFQKNKSLRPIVADFLERGVVFSQGRQSSCFIAAIDLLECGNTMEEALKALNESPFDRVGFNDREILQAVKSAAKHITKLMGG